MGKYAGTLTTQQVCKEEIKECKAILVKYHVSQEDGAKVTDIIQQAYHMLGESYKITSAMEAYMKDAIGENALQDFFGKYVVGGTPGEYLAEEIDRQEEDGKNMKNKENYI